MTPLSRVVAAALENCDELWWPKLAAQLVSNRAIELEKECGLSFGNYSTSSLLGVQALALFDFPLDGEQHCVKSIRLEALAPLIEGHFRKKGVSFYSAEDQSGSLLVEVLKAAFELIGLIPSLRLSVLDLVKILHVLVPQDATSDVSFSEPEIPFSIFVSVPKERVPHASLRVAEAIIHEAMHLQLSLVERVVPLVCGDEQPFYSPWKQTIRNTTGILHGIYVFAVINSWLERLPASLCSDYTNRRRAEIERQLKLNIAFPESAELTPIGCLLARAIMSRFEVASLSIRNV